MEADILRICAKILRKGLDYGADEVEVFSVAQRSMEAGIENNDLKLAKTNFGTSVGIRVFRDRCLGFACTNTLNAATLDKVLRNAISISKSAPRDEANGIPHASKISPIGEIYDEDIISSDERTILEKSSKILRVARDVDKRIVVESAKFEVIVGEKALVNSSGVEHSERFTAAYYDLMAHAIEGPTVSAADYRANGHRFLRDDDSERTTKQLVKSLILALRPKKLESFKGTLILSPIAAMELLLSPLLFSVDSNNVQKGVSRFKGMLGQRVAAGFIDVIDDGAIPRGLSSSSFDREGVPHKRMEILKNGVLNGYLYNQYTANKDARESTGHASGGPRSVPSIDATNIFIKEGTQSLENLISSVEKGLLVRRFSGRVDPVSGDMSGVAKMSQELIDGCVGDVVRETIISGNVYDMLLRIDRISSDKEQIFGIQLPYFKIDDISITGG